jgi:hypothetical protein
MLVLPSSIPTVPLTTRNPTLPRIRGMQSEQLPTYDAFDLRATGTNIAFMAVEAVAYLAIAIAVDMALSNPRVAARCKRDPGADRAPINDEAEDDDVAAERARVTAAAAADDKSASGAGDVAQLLRCV